MSTSVIQQSPVLDLDSEDGNFLRHIAIQGFERFSLLFDRTLIEGANRIQANTAPDFIRARTGFHLKLLLAAQFFLQKQVERAFHAAREGDKGLSRTALSSQMQLKMFNASSRICVLLACGQGHRFSSDKLLRALQALVPGISPVTHSNYLWHHPTLPYFMCYLEVRKVRGRYFEKQELKKLASSLRDSLSNYSPLTPTLFYPFNLEESIRQTQLLRHEVHSAEDLPHVSVHFSEQTLETLEFIIYLARPKGPKPLIYYLQQLPRSMELFVHVCQTREQPIPTEMAVFALKLSADAFNIRDSINLLYARRSILKRLEHVLGPFRDFNGGLFEKLQEQFEELYSHFHRTIPHLDYFGEKLFFSIYPLEARLFLPFPTFEKLFLAFAKIMQSSDRFICEIYDDEIFLCKASDRLIFHHYKKGVSEEPGITCSGQLSLGGSEYFFVISPDIRRVYDKFSDLGLGLKSHQKLRLVFQEGEPISLNPHQTMGDMRSRMISKLLFEGLTRLNVDKNPKMAGAESFSVDKGGLLYRFKLRENYWSNGVKVSSGDYVDSFYHSLKSHASHPEYLFSIRNARAFREGTVSIKEVGIRPLGGDVVEIELKEPDNFFLHKLAQPPFFPLAGLSYEPTWFNGPYLVSVQTKDSLVLERNPYFWNAAKKPHLESIEIKWLDDTNAIMELFQNGEAHWIGDPISPLPLNLIQKLEKKKAIKTQSVNRQFLLFFNTKSPPLHSPLLRKVLSMSVNRGAICRNIYSYCTPLEPVSHSREEIAYLFEQALRELGLTRATFPKLRIMSSNQAGRYSMAESLQKDWLEMLDIPVTIHQVAWNSFRDHLERGQFEMTFVIQDFPSQLTLDYLERFEGSNSWNFSMWESAHYRSLLANIRLEKDPTARYFLMQETYQYLKDQMPFSPLCTYTHLFAHTKHLKGFMNDEEGCVDFSTAYFEEN